jgi:hypothetical protein
MHRQIVGLAFCIAAFAVSAAAQTNTFPASGNVGIGTTSPGYSLVVNGNAETGNLFPIADNAYSLGFSYQRWSSINGANGYFSGEVGIGTTTPNNKLTVGGDIGFPSYGGIGSGLAFNAYYSGGWYAAAAGQSTLITQGTGSDNSLNIAVSGYENGPGSPITWTNALNILGSGVGANVGIGTTTPGATDSNAKLEVNGGDIVLTYTSTNPPPYGIVFADGTKQTTAFIPANCGADFAESVDVTGDRTKYEPGDILVIDPSAPGKFLKSNQAYSTLVAGIYSTKPGFVGRLHPEDAKTGKTEVPMAMVGRVPTKVSAENGPIKVGDLLVASSKLGYAMKGTNRTQMLGAVIGKALGSLDSGTGVIEVLVTLQ